MRAPDYAAAAIKFRKLEKRVEALEASPMLTVTTGYVIKQRYSDDSWHVVGRKKTILRAGLLRDSLKSHYGNQFKIVRMYRRVRYSHG